jgi:hypothetical protein
MKALHDKVPHLTPKPIAYGMHASNSNIQFFISGFVEMTDKVSNHSFMVASADLHSKWLRQMANMDFQS